MRMLHRILLRWKRFLQCEDIRRSGSAAFDLAHVAEGSVEAYFERNLKIWDYAAGLLIIREAGGRVTDYEGNEIKLTSTINNVVADNGYLGGKLRAYYPVTPSCFPQSPQSVMISITEVSTMETKDVILEL